MACTVSKNYSFTDPTNSLSASTEMVLLDYRYLIENHINKLVGELPHIAMKDHPDSSSTKLFRILQKRKVKTVHKL